MTRIIDGLDHIEASMPELSGRLDRSRIAAAGHLMGGHTTALLLGMRLIDPYDGTEANLADSRIKAGVLLTATGGSDGLTAGARERYPMLGNLNFAPMTAPALVVAGDKDLNPMFSERPNWRAEAYSLSTGPKCMLMSFGAEHMLGGLSGYDAAETTDESPERVAVVQRMTWGYLRTALYPDDRAWDAAQTALAGMSNAPGRIECK